MTRTTEMPHATKVHRTIHGTARRLAVGLGATVLLGATAPAAQAFNPQPEPPAEQHQHEQYDGSDRGFNPQPEPPADGHRYQHQQQYQR